MSSGRMLALAVVLLVAALVSAVAPTHPVYNPPVCKFLLSGLALGAAMGAQEAAKWPSTVVRSEDEIEFVVSFDDRVVRLACPDGSSESARWDDIERISIQPDEDYFLIWTGPFFVVLQVRGHRLLIPAFTSGLDAFLRRLTELPGIDREKLATLSPGVLWTREGKA